MSSSVVKGNRPLRMFAIMVLIVLTVAQILGQIDLTELSFLWLLILMALNALQASFSGFCPMFKNAKGECVACGVACNEPASENKDGSCCDGGGSGKGCDADKSSSQREAVDKTP
ncbi:DUF2892 domain-containing protein [Hydrogenovibrio sp. SC-1]|uniref:YgaP family membrane protein n=1 Tax=Hydrogenovibrio sp. SC-1 TaxID=2065820 RepID=UPI000C7CA9FA|nr:DUF2892 domain-containing protein [Hydrogenovibrio sp. SC-1]PLA74286.1 DUF2892 domain-containing protein [Hydrogenovibrio sp. SC-1]